MIKLLVDLLGVWAEVVMLYYLYENVLIHKPNFNKQRLILYLLVGILFMSISTFIPWPRIRTGLYILTAFLPLIAYQNKWQVCTLTGLIYVTGQSVTEMTIKALLLSIYGEILIWHYVLGVLLSKTLAFFMIYLIVSLLRVRAHTLSLQLFLPLLALPIASMITIYLVIDISYLIDTIGGYLRLIAVCILLISANIAMCYLFSRISEMENIRQREILANFHVTLQQKQYAQLITHQEEIHRMHHDIKRHLRILGQYLQENRLEQALDYIEQQEISINQAPLTITGYSLLDGVLSSKQELAQQYHICWQCQAYILPHQTLPEADIAIMLDNALDNAIEAAALLDNADRWITINIKQQQTLLHFVIRNSTNHEPLSPQQIALKTTKPTSANHGLGLTNIHMLAKKHNGTMLYECDGQIFTLRVMVNISNSGVNVPETVLASKL